MTDTDEQGTPAPTAEEPQFEIVSDEYRQLDVERPVRSPIMKALLENNTLKFPADFNVSKFSARAKDAGFRLRQRKKGEFRYAWLEPLKDAGKAPKSG